MQIKRRQQVYIYPLFTSAIFQKFHGCSINFFSQTFLQMSCATDKANFLHNKLWQSVPWLFLCPLISLRLRHASSTKLFNMQVCASTLRLRRYKAVLFFFKYSTLFLASATSLFKSCNRNKFSSIKMSILKSFSCQQFKQYAFIDTNLSFFTIG